MPIQEDEAMRIVIFDPLKDCLYASLRLAISGFFWRKRCPIFIKCSVKQLIQYNSPSITGLDPLYIKQKSWARKKRFSTFITK